MKILITGGSGFIGSQVVEQAVALGASILNIDLKPPRLSRHRPFWQAIDIRDERALEQAALVFQPTQILHLASDIDISITRLQDFKTITNGTANILNVARELPDLKCFLHTSTQFVVRPGVEPSSERYLDPYTVYGEAKAHSEEQVWAAKLGVPWVIVRPTIIWGPNHPSFAENIFRHIGSRSYLHPTAARPIVRAFGYVDNTAAQMLAIALLRREVRTRQVYYLGDAAIDYDQWADAFSIALTGKPARRIPLALLKALGLAGDAIKLTGLPSPIDSGRAFRMSTSSMIDLSPTLNLVGVPPIDFTEGVQKTVQWLYEKKS